MVQLEVLAVLPISVSAFFEVDDFGGVRDPSALVFDVLVLLGTLQVGEVVLPLDRVPVEFAVDVVHVDRLVIAVHVAVFFPNVSCGAKYVGFRL